MHEFFKSEQIALVLRTHAILYIFEKLTRACFSQIALETILLPILTRKSITFNTCITQSKVTWFDPLSSSPRIKEHPTPYKKPFLDSPLHNSMFQANTLLMEICSKCQILLHK